MKIFFIVLLGMAAFVLLMAVGVLMGRKPIEGSCGGMAAVGLEGACDVCGGDLQKCEEETKKRNEGSSTKDDDALFYDANDK